MQNLWRLGIFFLIAPVAYGGELRVATWNMEWFPSGSSSGHATPEIEATNISSAANLLTRLDSDILVLEEIRDLKTCEALVNALKPLTYHVAVCSQFKDSFSGAIGLQQVAILSKQPAVVAWAEDWKSFGVVDPPRGFAFAAFHIGTNDVGVYGVHLKSNLTRGNAERERQLNILKRELAAEQVLNRAAQVSTLLSNKLEVAIVAGDFNTTLDQLEFASEKTLSIFQQHGFSSGYEGIPPAQRVSIRGKGQYPDATFDYIFVNPMAISGSPLITKSAVSDHYPVLRVIYLP
jgi:endonuclease/exonuclease/phosphatase family metal-dependent hydrolase